MGSNPIEKKPKHRHTRTTNTRNGSIMQEALPRRQQQQRPRQKEACQHPQQAVLRRPSLDPPPTARDRRNPPRLIYSPASTPGKGMSSVRLKKARGFESEIAAAYQVSTLSPAYREGVVG